MRELTLLETGYLAGLVLLSLVMPLLTSFGSSRKAATASLKIVWTGQIIGALAALAVILSAPSALFAAILGAAGYLGCAFVLLRNLKFCQHLPATPPRP